MVFHAREDLLDVAYADGTADWRGKACSGSESKVEAVFEGLPFVVGEEAAPVGEADSDGFVGTESLCVICGGVSLRMTKLIRPLPVSLSVHSNSPVMLPRMRSYASCRYTAAQSRATD